MVPTEQGRLCAHQPGFLSACVWWEYICFPPSLSGGSRGVGKPKLPGMFGGSTMGL